MHQFFFTLNIITQRDCFTIVFTFFLLEHRTKALRLLVPPYIFGVLPEGADTPQHPGFYSWAYGTRVTLEGH